MTTKTATRQKTPHHAGGPKPAVKPAPRPPSPPSPETAAKIQAICGGLDQLNEDTSVPRNIRRSAEEAKRLLLQDPAPLDVRKSSAINLLDDMANDPNLPLHGRTLIWSIMSQLEPLA